MLLANDINLTVITDHAEYCNNNIKMKTVILRYIFPAVFYEFLLVFTMYDPFAYRPPQSSHYVNQLMSFM